MTRQFRVGEWLADPSLDELRRGGTATKIEPRMMRLLCLLADRRGEVVATNEILDKVWTGVVVSSNSVYQAIAQLRRHLGDDEGTPRYIVTVPRKGYRLIADVAPETSADARVDDAAAGARPEPVRSPLPPSSPETSPATRRRPSVGMLLAGAAVVAIALAAVWMFRPNAPGERDAAAPAAVAVLQFADLSVGGVNEDFCAGLTDELLNSIARLPGVRVTGRTSSARYRSNREDAREIGRALGVTHVLEGSVRRSGSRVRINAQLVSTRDGFHVWSNSFDRPVSDVLGIQADIARAVADALAVQLSPAARQRLSEPVTKHVNAYDLYLLGRHAQLARTPESLALAIQHHTAAVAADPRFALPHAGLADAHMARFYYENRPLAEIAPLVQQEVDAALRLDPELAEAYAAWAVLLTEQWRTDEAIEKLQRAIAINSNYGEAYLRLGAAHEYAGRPRDAIAAYDQVAVLDPLHSILHVRRCLVLQNLGRYRDADRACERAFELQPDIPNALWARSLNAMAQGDLARAGTYHREALVRAPQRADIRGELVRIYLDAGALDAARDESARLRTSAVTLAGRLEEARVALASADRSLLARHLAVSAFATARPREKVEAAWLALAAGDDQLAAALLPADLEPQRAIDEDLSPGVYRMRWGVCDLCAIAFFERRAGSVSSATRYEQAALDYLSRIEQAGHVWHGLHYVRATIHGARGDRARALQSLERAVELGWRRAWFMRVDPAFAELRGEPRFIALLSRIDSEGAKARTKLQTARAARAGVSS